MERQRVAEKEAETQKKIAISEAQKNAQVSMIQMEQKLMEKDSARKQEEISNEMYKAREKSLADASFYRSFELPYPSYACFHGPFSSVFLTIYLCGVIKEVSFLQIIKRSRSKQVEAHSPIFGAQIH